MEKSLHLDIFGSTFRYHVTDLYVLLGECALVGIFYLAVQGKFSDSLKKQAWLIMFLLSLVLAASSIIYGVHVELNGGYTFENVFSENIYSRSIVTFFMACNIMDIIIGMVAYPSYMDPFTTYLHHAFYISTCVTYIGLGKTLVFLLGFFVEIPTAILNLGVVFPKMRMDLIYGIVFFICRIFYHIIFAYRVYLIDDSGLNWKLILIPFPAHVLWFYKWTIGYLKKSGGKQKST